MNCLRDNGNNNEPTMNDRRMEKNEEKNENEIFAQVVMA